LGHHREGVDVDDSVAADDAADGSLRLHLDVGAGQVEVVRAGSVPRVIPPVGVPSPPLPPSPPSTVGLG
jgi:hypothetical protein